jgi:hypothetical protein
MRRRTAAGSEETLGMATARGFKRTFRFRIARASW